MPRDKDVKLDFTHNLRGGDNRKVKDLVTGQKPLSPEEVQKAKKIVNDVRSIIDSVGDSKIVMDAISEESARFMESTDPNGKSVHFCLNGLVHDFLDKQNNIAWAKVLAEAKYNGVLQQSLDNIGQKLASRVPGKLGNDNSDSGVNNQLSTDVPISLSYSDRLAYACVALSSADLRQYRDLKEEAITTVRGGGELWGAEAPPLKRGSTHHFDNMKDNGLYLRLKGTVIMQFIPKIDRGGQKGRYAQQASAMMNSVCEGIITDKDLLVTHGLISSTISDIWNKSKQDRQSIKLWEITRIEG